MTPIKSIRAKCLECSCGQTKEVLCCSIPDCPLYPYRMGKRPKLNDRIATAFEELEAEGEEISTEEDDE